MEKSEPLTLYELSGAEDRRFSPYCWRIRYSLAHKHLGANYVPVPFTKIPGVVGDGQHNRVPIVRHNGDWISDSWQIAKYLESQCQEPTLFPGGSPASTRFFNLWVDSQLHPLLLRAMIGDLYEIIDPCDRAYFRESREKRLGEPLEKLAKRREEYLEALGKPLQFLTQSLQEGPFFSGRTPGYADYVLAGTFEWVNRASSVPIPQPNSALSNWFARVQDRTFGDHSN